MKTALRIQTLPLFDPTGFLYKRQILSMETPGRGEPFLSGRLILEPEFVEVFTTGKVGLPQLSMNFLAEHITTPMEWEDIDRKSTRRNYRQTCASRMPYSAQ